MKHSIKLFFLAAGIQALPGMAEAYETLNHYDVTQQALSVSELVTDPTKIPNLGLTGLGQKFPVRSGADDDDIVAMGCAHGQKLDIFKIIKCGSQYEDVPSMRALNHFYDSQNNRALTFAGVTWGMKSPDWALEDTVDDIYQIHSYRHARDYFFKALTSNDGWTAAGKRENREDKWGMMLQSLGMILHHVADNAAPQHVRNDQHLVFPIPFVYNPSLYEKYTKSHREVVSIYGSNSVTAAPVFTSSNPGQFTRPRDFFDGPNGLNQFTNQNFFSDGTNFRHLDGQYLPAAEFAQPVPFPAAPVAIQDLDPPVSVEVLTECPTCIMRFIATSKDVYNPQAATYSILDKYVNLRPITFPLLSTDGSFYRDMIPTLNRYNFDYQHRFLIPKAVGYSAGLINYFFRGKLDISLPDEQIYSVADHQPGAAGFTRVKAKVKLMESTEAVGAGTLTAVAKFHRNTCYTDSLSGEIGAEPSPGATCRSPDEDIVVSAPKSLTAGALSTTAQQFTFEFSDAIPFGATDLYLQVVFRGALGAEPDAVVVGTKDISEPTFDVGFYNALEQYLFGMVYPYNNLTTFENYYCTDDPDCRITHRYTHHVRFAEPLPGFNYADPTLETFGPRTIEYRDIAVGDFGRAAILTDNAASQTYYVVNEYPLTAWIGQAQQGTFAPAKVQAQPGTDTIVLPTRYREARGIYATDEVYTALTTGDAYTYPGYTVPDMWHTTPRPANINFAP